MGRILDFVQAEGHGHYLCYKTRKASLDNESSDILTYDDKPSVQIYGSQIAESNRTRVHTVDIPHRMIDYQTSPIFSYFLDGSRHTYKVDDIAIGSHIYPFLAGQIIVGCCERRGRDCFKKVATHHKLVLSLPIDFNVDDDENFCRLFLEKINSQISQLPYVAAAGIHFDDILLYETDALSRDEKRKDGLLNRGVARIQTVMTDDEQLLVAELCRRNLLDDDHWLIKDGSLEYSPSAKLKEAEWLRMRNNYQYVVGVSKQFNPDLILDFEKNKLSKTIASLKPFQRTKVYRYCIENNSVEYAIWYLRLRNSDFRETHFSDVVKCEMIIPPEKGYIDTDIVNIISANIIQEAYPVCYGSDTRWTNHLYPVFLTEKFCKSHYIDTNIILNLF